MGAKGNKMNNEIVKTALRQLIIDGAVDEGIRTYLLTFAEKMLAFAWLLEYEQIERLVLERLDCEANILNRRTSIHWGLKYAKVDVGSSGKYMVALKDIPAKLVKRGEIVAIKAYGVPHLGHRYGTLDTIHEWDWRGYRACPRAVAEWASAAGEVRRPRQPLPCIEPPSVPPSCQPH
jgi:hypothetical protein